MPRIGKGLIQKVLELDEKEWTLQIKRGKEYTQKNEETQTGISISLIYQSTLLNNFLWTRLSSVRTGPF